MDWRCNQLEVVMSEQLWWLSFADEDLPIGEQFLGACIVPGTSIIDACQCAHTSGVNPGGDVCGLPIPHHSQVEPKEIGVLMDRAACKAFDDRRRK